MIDVKGSWAKENVRYEKLWLPNNPINLADVADEDERPDVTQEQKPALRGVASMYATLCYSNEKKRTILESRATTATAKEIRGGKGSIDDEEIIGFATRTMKLREQTMRTTKFGEGPATEVRIDLIALGQGRED